MRSIDADGRDGASEPAHVVSVQLVELEGNARLDEIDKLPMDARPLEPLLAIGRVVRKRRSVLAHDVVERGEGVDGLHDAPQRRRLVWLEPARLHRRAYHCTRCTACA